MEDPADKLHGKVPVDISGQLIQELERLDETKAKTTKLTEKDFPKKEFPIRPDPNAKGIQADNGKWYYNWEGYKWNEKEIREFYKDPENISRTIFCRKMNVDELDDWGMFGYEPGFIYIEEVRYKGEKTLADEAASLGLSVAVDPKTGLGVMNHFDYFPKMKFDYQLIRKSEYPEVFEIMCDIFSHKRIGNQGQESSPLLGSGAESV